MAVWKQPFWDVTPVPNTVVGDDEESSESTSSSSSPESSSSSEDSGSPAVHWTTEVVIPNALAKFTNGTTGSKKSSVKYPAPPNPPPPGVGRVFTLDEE